MLFCPSCYRFKGFRRGLCQPCADSLRHIAEPITAVPVGVHAFEAPFFSEQAGEEPHALPREAGEPDPRNQIMRNFANEFPEW